MNRRIAISLVLGGTFALSAGLAGAQEAPPPPPRGEARMPGGPGGPGGDRIGEPFGDRIELLGFEGMHGGKVVTGAPFSAVAVSESTQTLADGNRISRKIQTSLFRDSQGRFRKEVTLPAIGPLAASGTPKSFFIISDPVTGTSFILRPDTKTAEQMFSKRKGAMGGGMKDMMKEKFDSHVQEEVANGTLKKEDLGTQSIAGVLAQGSRVTKTIPAGQIGNEKPILIVNETWYSNDLQMVVKSTRSNPWSGESTYILTNIQRSEPAASLFAVPSDFTVQEGRAGKRGMKRPRQGPPPPADN